MLDQQNNQKLEKKKKKEGEIRKFSQDIASKNSKECSESIRKANNNTINENDIRFGGRFTEIGIFQQSQALLPREIDGEALNRMLKNVKTAEIRLSQLKKTCSPHCSCNVCIRNKFTRNVKIENYSQILWYGNVIINPNNHNYQILRASLNYLQFCNFAIFQEIVQIKYLLDANLRLPIIKLTRSINVKEQTTVLANRDIINHLMTHLILAVVSIKQKYWTKFTEYNQAIEGFLYKKYSFGNQWQRKFVKIAKFAIQEEKNGQMVFFNSQCLWTKFEFINFQIPHLIIKIWEGFSKVQYALPIDRLSQWLLGFLTIVKLT